MFWFAIILLAPVFTISGIVELFGFIGFLIEEFLHNPFGLF